MQRYFYWIQCFRFLEGFNAPEWRDLGIHSPLPLFFGPLLFCPKESEMAIRERIWTCCRETRQIRTTLQDTPAAEQWHLLWPSLPCLAMWWVLTGGTQFLCWGGSRTPLLTTGSKWGWAQDADLTLLKCCNRRHVLPEDLTRVLYQVLHNLF